MVLEKRIALLACAMMALAITGTAQLTPAEEGRRAYLANNCYGCHGGRAGGGVFGFTAPEFRGEGAEIGDLTEVLREGGEAGMPAFRNLTTTDIGNLAAYLQSLRTPSEPTFNLWWEPVPTATNRSRVPRLYAASVKPALDVPRKEDHNSSNRAVSFDAVTWRLVRTLADEAPLRKSQEGVIDYAADTAPAGPPTDNSRPVAALPGIGQSPKRAERQGGSQ